MSAFCLAAKHSLPETKPDQGMSTSDRPNGAKTRKTGGISASNHDRSTTIRPRTGRVKDVQVDNPPYIVWRSLFGKKKNQDSDPTRWEGNIKALITRQGNGQAYHILYINAARLGTKTKLPVHRNGKILTRQAQLYEGHQVVISRLQNRCL